MSTRYRITTPVIDFTGVVGGCSFANGVYEGPVGDGPLAYFQTQGYGVEEIVDEPAEETPVEEPIEETPPPVLPAKSAPKADWVDAAIAHAVASGEDPAKARAAAESLNKEQLIELLTPKGAQE